MNGKTMKSRLLASSVFAGAAFMAQANMLAIAQEADEAVDTVETTTEDATARQQTVYVTGSRIQSPNMTTTSPVSSVSAEDIKLQGVTRVEDLVTQLPQLSPRRTRPFPTVHPVPQRSRCVTSVLSVHWS